MIGLTATCPHCGHALAPPAPPRLGLTEQQSLLLDFLTLRQADGGPSPNYDEMRAALGYSANGGKAGVHRLVVALEERDYIDRKPGRARSISVRSVA